MLINFACIILSTVISLDLAVAFFSKKVEPAEIIIRVAAALALAYIFTLIP